MDEHSCNWSWSLDPAFFQVAQGHWEDYRRETKRGGEMPQRTVKSTRVLTIKLIVVLSIEIFAMSSRATPHYL